MWCAGRANYGTMMRRRLSTTFGIIMYLGAGLGSRVGMNTLRDARDEQKKLETEVSRTVRCLVKDVEVVAATVAVAAVEATVRGGGRWF